MRNKRLLIRSLQLTGIAVTIISIFVLNTLLPIYGAAFAFVMWKWYSEGYLPRWVVWMASVLFVGKSLFVLSNVQSRVFAFEDSWLYYAKLQEFVSMNNMSIHSAMSTMSSSHVLYLYWMRINYVFGEDAALIISNVLLGTIGTFLFYRVFKEFGERIASVSFILISLSTNIMLFSSNLLKDSLVFFLMGLGFYFLKVKRKYWLVSVCVLLLTMTRIYAGMSLLVVMVYVFMKSYYSIKRKAFLLVVMSAILYFSNFGRYWNSAMTYLKENLNLDKLMSIPTAILKFTFSPLPWNVSYDVYFITIIDSYVFLFSIPIFIALFFKLIRINELRGKLIPYLIPVLIHAVALGIQYNGNSTRQRIGILAFLFLFIAIGLLYKKDNTQIGMKVLEERRLL